MHSNLLDGLGMKEVNMLELMHIFDERAATNVLTEEMQSLYLFSFLLTADNDVAEQCYVCGLGECVEGISVFMDWARSWARQHDSQACHSDDHARARADG